MEKEFVAYDIALALKELGFDEPCLLVYDSKEKVLFHCLSNNVKNDILIDCNIGLNPKEDIKAPTFSQTFRWFREKYNLIPDIQYYGNWNFEIFRIGEFAEPMDDVNVDYTFKGGTYEETELECLKKLIEIVKKK